MATPLTLPSMAPRTIPTGNEILGLQSKDIAVSGGDRAKSISSAGQAPAAPNPTEGFKKSMANIINTGKATPQQATLIDPKTGDRKAVPTGSPQAQELFGAGYVLEQSQGKPAAGARSATTGQVFSGSETIPQGGLGGTDKVESNPDVPIAPVTQSKLEFLRSEARKTKTEAFATAYGYTPDEWQNQPPEVQRQLRNERIQGLAAQYGNYTDAITQVKEETKTAKDDALKSLNTFIEMGVLGDVGDAELSSLANQAGIPISGLKAIAKKGAGYELKQLGDQLVAIKMDPTTGKVMIADTYTPPKKAGSGAAAPGAISYATINGQSYPSDFVEYYKNYIEPLTVGQAGPVAPGLVASEFKKWSEAKTKVTPTAPRQRYTELQQYVEAGTDLPSLLNAFPDISADEIRKAYNDFNK